MTRVEPAMRVRLAEVQRRMSTIVSRIFSIKSAVSWFLIGSIALLYLHHTRSEWALFTAYAEQHCRAEVVLLLGAAHAALEPLRCVLVGSDEVLVFEIEGTAESRMDCSYSHVPWDTPRLTNCVIY